MNPIAETSRFTPQKQCHLYFISSNTNLKSIMTQENTVLHFREWIIETLRYNLVTVHETKIDRSMFEHWLVRAVLLLVNWYCSANARCSCLSGGHSRRYWHGQRCRRTGTRTRARTGTRRAATATRRRSHELHLQIFQITSKISSSDPIRILFKCEYNKVLRILYWAGLLVNSIDREWLTRVRSRSRRCFSSLSISTFWMRANSS